MTIRQLSRGVLVATLSGAASVVAYQAVAQAQTDRPFTWCPSVGAVAYVIEWSQEPRTLNGQTVTTPGWKPTGAIEVPAPAVRGIVPSIQLLPATRYYFSIRAKDATGVLSGYDNEVCVRTGATAPACNVYLPVPTTCEGDPEGKLLPAPSIRIRTKP